MRLRRETSLYRKRYKIQIILYYDFNKYKRNKHPAKGHLPKLTKTCTKNPDSKYIYGRLCEIFIEEKTSLKNILLQSVNIGNISKFIL